MNTHISETAPIRTIENLINEAKSLGLRVVHRPEPKLYVSHPPAPPPVPKASNVVKLWDEANTRRMQMCVSPEAA